MQRTPRRLLGAGVAALLSLLVGLAFSARLRRGRAARVQELAPRAAAARHAAAPLPVLVVRGEVLPGTILTRELLAVVHVPRALAPEGVDQGKIPRTAEEVLDMVALARLSPGEPVRHERLADRNDLRTVSYFIRPGFRAVSLRMTLDSAVGGFVRQGDFVDVLGTFEVPGASPITKAVLERARILAVDRTYVPRGPGAVAATRPSAPDVPDDPFRAYSSVGMVTFEVTPSDAEKLLLASGRVPLELVLRHPEDTGTGAPVLWDRPVFGPPEAGDSPPEEPAGVEVLLGARRTRQGP